MLIYLDIICILYNIRENKQSKCYDTPAHNYISHLLQFLLSIYTFFNDLSNLLFIFSERIIQSY